MYEARTTEECENDTITLTLNKKKNISHYEKLSSTSTIAIKL